MSISHLLSSNNGFNIKPNSVEANTINAISLTKNGNPVSYYNYDFIQNNSNSQTYNVPPSGNIDDPSTWAVCDTVFASTGGTYNIVLDDKYNVHLKVAITLANSSGVSDYGGAIAMQFQNVDDSWNTVLANLPNQWQFIWKQETNCIILCHKLNNGHGFKRVRLLVGSSSPGIDIRYGFGNTKPSQFYCILERTYSL